MFSDRIEAQVPPAKGRAHVMRVVREILTCQPGRSRNGHRRGAGLRAAAARFAARWSS